MKTVHRGSPAALLIWAGVGLMGNVGDRPDQLCLGDMKADQALRIVLRRLDSRVLGRDAFFDRPSMLPTKVAVAELSDRPVEPELSDFCVLLRLTLVVHSDEACSDESVE